MPGLKRHLPRCLCALFSACVLCACGAEVAVPSSPWQRCEIVGLEQVSGAALLGDQLALCAGGGDRAIHLVALADLVPGARVSASALRVDLDREALITGRGLLARRAYTLADLWEAGVDLQAVAVQKPDILLVADRAFRVVYWGRVVRGINGSWSMWQLRRGFEVPGADRAQRAKADYRDLGPGLSGMFGVSGQVRTEDLFVAERARPGGEEAASQFRVLMLDRYGNLGGKQGSLGFLVMDVGQGRAPQVEALAYDRAQERFLCLRGGGRGAIVSFKKPRGARPGTLGAGVPGPAPEGAGRWRGLTIGSDGTWYLVSDGSPTVVAWRTP